MWRNWPRRRCWLVSVGTVLALAVPAAACALHNVLHIPRPPLPLGVSKRTEKITLTGQTVAVEFYLASRSGPAPVVVIAHGFSRNRKTMAGWGGMLAKEGLLAVVPDLALEASASRTGWRGVPAAGRPSSCSA